MKPSPCARVRLRLFRSLPSGGLSSGCAPSALLASLVLTAPAHAATPSAPVAAPGAVATTADTVPGAPAATSTAVAGSSPTSAPAAGTSLTDGNGTPPSNRPSNAQASVPFSRSAGPGPLASVGRTLADKGLYLRATVIDEFAGSVSGGQRKGSGNSYAIPFGADLDLGRAIGLAGGALHMTMNVSRGSSLSSDTGNAVSFQTRYKSYHNLRLAALAYEQKLFDGKLEIAGGRVSPLSYFNQSPLWCVFQSNASCFTPAVVPIRDKALGFFPYGTWGGRVKVAPDKRFYAQVGVFEANLSLISTNGFDWSTKGSTGHQTIGEVGFQSVTPKAPHAWHLRLGAYHNSSDIADPYRNTNGQPRLSDGGTALMHDGQYGLYASGDIVAGHLGGSAARPVTLFAGANLSPHDYTAFRAQYLAGAVIAGPLASRPHDTLGLMASYLRMGSQEVAYLRAARAAAGGTDRLYSGEAIVELNYGIAAARGVQISPNVQYVLHPDNMLVPRAARQSGDILAFGLRLTVNLAQLAGLPALR